jgi:hypothetical protein
MSTIEIQWLSDSYDCETCGRTWAEGAIVKIDGQIAMDLTPYAHCFDGVHCERDDVMVKILEHLGHTVSTTD